MDDTDHTTNRAGEAERDRVERISEEAARRRLADRRQEVASRPEPETDIVRGRP